MIRRAALALLAAAACSGGDDDGRATAPVEPPPTLVTPVDAATATTDGGITVIPGYDPRSGLHLDDDDGGPPTRTAGGGARNRRTLEIVLRSSPSGATAVVDGQVVGKTPTFWEGEFTGRDREFTFVLPGHALARYRFVPITNGIVHARLIPVLSEAGALLPFLPPLVAAPRPAKRAPAPVVDATVEAAAGLDAAAAVEVPDAAPTDTAPDGGGTGRTGSGPTP